LSRCELFSGTSAVLGGNIVSLDAAKRPGDTIPWPDAIVAVPVRLAGGFVDRLLGHDVVGADLVHRMMLHLMGRLGGRRSGRGNQGSGRNKEGKRGKQSFALGGHRGLHGRRGYCEAVHSRGEKFALID
jgi:hypothetical protein